jgi:hypothetical protein
MRNISHGIIAHYPKIWSGRRNPLSADFLIPKYTNLIPVIQYDGTQIQKKNRLELAAFDN